MYYLLQAFLGGYYKTPANKPSVITSLKVGLNKSMHACLKDLVDIKTTTKFNIIKLRRK